MTTRSPISTWTFCLTLVKSGRRVLLVRELDGSWGVPGGRLERGETLAACARREVREETGLDVELEGVLRVQYTPILGGETRLRVLFVGRPADDRSPKQTDDGESLGAQWFTRQELEGLSMRSADVLELVSQALDGPVYPMSLVAAEK